MEKSKNIKLKLGLCGLALTSFLALNMQNKTVRADSMNSSAISWDSDNDSSQTVKKEPEQQPAQVAQEQMPASASQVQPVQNKKTMVSNVSSLQEQAHNNTVNHVNTGNQTIKVANVNATDPIKIINPQNNQVVVHYTKTNGQAISGLADRTIDLSKTGNGNYAPSGYQLAQGNGSYNVNVTSKETIPDFDTYWDVSDKLHMHKGQSYQTETGTTDFNTKWDSNGNYDGAVDGQLVMDNDAKRAILNLVRNAAKATSQGDLLTGYTTDEGTSVPMNYFYVSYDPLIYDSGEHVDRFRITYGGDNWDASPYAWVQDSHYRNLNDEDSTFDWNDADFQLAEKIKNWWFATRKAAGIANPDSNAIFDDYVQNDNGGHGFPTYPMFVASSNGEQFANGDTIFTDSGSATSAVGNHINVPLMQEVPVNAGDEVRKTAERVISVNLPDDPAVKERYKGILNSNNQIVQTLTFTRSMTKDALTGATLKQTPWQGPSSFPEVTLPDIPGYTMTMN